jgi:hypothetical protein
MRCRSHDLGAAIGFVFLGVAHPITVANLISRMLGIILLHVNDHAEKKCACKLDLLSDKYLLL